MKYKENKKGKDDLFTTDEIKNKIKTNRKHHLLVNGRKMKDRRPMFEIGLLDNWGDLNHLFSLKLTKILR